jgi:hypothetical protein
MAIAPQAEFLYHISQAILLLSNLVSNIFLVRVFLCLGFLILAFWAFLTLDNFVASVAWLSVFVVVNAVHIARLLYAKRKIRFSTEVQEIYDSCFARFAGFTPLEFKELWDLGEDRVFESGDTIVREGSDCTQLGFLIGGRITKYACDVPVNSITRDAQDPEEWFFFNTYAAAVTCRSHDPATYMPCFFSSLCVSFLRCVLLLPPVRRLEFVSASKAGGVCRAHLTRRATLPRTRVRLWDAGRLLRRAGKRPELLLKLTTLVCMDLVRKLGDIDDVRCRGLTLCAVAVCCCCLLSWRGIVYFWLDHTSFSPCCFLGSPVAVLYCRAVVL